jgi:uncharacterized protein (UPF0548 family)
VLRLRKPSQHALQELLVEARAASPSYSEVGATRHESLPAGFRHDRYEVRLGQGSGVFERAVQALRRLQPQRGAGVEVVPRDAWVDDQETVVLLLRAAGLWAPAPCRVVYVINEADRFGFAYGTLPGHPEMGEVAFAVSRDPVGEIDFRVTSFSRTVDPLARLGVPVTRWIQKRVTRRYLTALEEATAREPQKRAP